MSMNEEDKYEELIEEFSKQRKALNEMIVDLEKFKAKIDLILPENMDKRYIRFFEEKIKSVTELFKAILDIRKEISKSVKDEFELRRKISVGDSDEDLGNVFDIRKIADKVDRLRREKILLEQNGSEEGINSIIDDDKEINV